MRQRERPAKRRGRGGAKSVIFHILAGIVFVLGGLYFITHPLMGLSTLTLFLASVIIVAGIFEIIAYFRIQGTQASGWMLFNGIVALLLGGLIWFHWPNSSVWAIGTLVGVSMLFSGFPRLMLSLAARGVVNKLA